MLLESVSQTKEDLLQAKEAEVGHLNKLVELKQKIVTETQSSSKVKYFVSYMYSIVASMTAGNRSYCSCKSYLASVIHKLTAFF